MKPQITYRQRQIWTLLALDYRVRDIACTLGLSARTVDNHKADLYRRLKVKGLSGITRAAIANGIVTAPTPEVDSVAHVQEMAILTHSPQNVIRSKSARGLRGRPKGSVNPFHPLNALNQIGASVTLPIGSYSAPNLYSAARARGYKARIRRAGAEMVVTACPLVGQSYSSPSYSVL